MWTGLTKDIEGKKCVYEMQGVSTDARVEATAIGSAFVKIDLHIPEVDERVTVTGYIPHMQFGVDDVEGEVTIRQDTDNWVLHFDRESIGDSQ